MNTPIDYSILIPHIKKTLEQISLQSKKISKKDISYKDKENNNPVTAVDKDMQTSYEKRFKDNQPDVTLIGEEDTTPTDTINNQLTIVFIDPIDGTTSFIEKRLWQVASLITYYHANQILAVLIGNVGNNTLLYYTPDTAFWSLISHDFQDDSESTISYDHTLASSQPIALLWHDKQLSNTIIMPSFTEKTEWIGGSRSHIIGQMCCNQYSGVIIDPWVKEPRDRLPMMWICKQMWYQIYTQNNNARIPTPWSDYILPITFQLQKPLLICHPDTFLDK
jgi:fructose-1,6-bisphosphatase/inositol monophosphatase family enzyme